MKNIVIGVLALIVLVLAVFVVMGPSKTTEPQVMQNDQSSSTAITVNPDTSKVPATPSTPKKVPTSTNTFHSIFTQSGAHMCNFEQVTSSSQSANVIYIADGKMRAEFRTTSGTDHTANLMIYSGGYLYSWSEGATTGTKSTIHSVADLPKAIPTDLTSGAIFSNKGDSVSWHCDFWGKDAKIFVPPTYVKFVAA